MDDIEIQVWTEPWKRHKELIDGWLSFKKHEPLNTGVDGKFDEHSKEKLARMLYDLLNTDHKTPLIVAWDRVREKVAGYIISATVYENTEAHRLPGEVDMRPPDSYCSSDQQTEQMKNLKSFLADVEKRCDLFNRLSIEKYWYIRCTTVCPEYTRRGICNRLTARVLQEAKKAGHTTVASITVSEYTRRDKIMRHHFEQVYELEFKNNYLNYSRMPAEICATHDKACVLVKRL